VPLAAIEDSSDRRFLGNVNCELIIVFNLDPSSGIDALEANQRRDPIGDICQGSLILKFRCQRSVTHHDHLIFQLIVNNPLGIAMSDVADLPLDRLLLQSSLVRWARVKE